MRKTLLLLILFVFSFSAIYAADDIKWEISNDGTLTISGTGNMTDYNISRKKSPWNSRSNEIKKVVIKDGVTNIGSYAFYLCGNLTSVTIPNSMTSIGSSAFIHCKSLTSIKIPNSVKSIGGFAFYNCSALTSVTIPNSVTSIERYAFWACEALKSITFNGSTPPKFGEYVFGNDNYFYNSIPVYVPANSRETYKDALKGYGMSNIKAIPLSLNFQDNYTQNSQIDDIDVFYTRTYTAKWEALYLPFSLKYEDWKDDFEVARINAVRQYDTDDDGDIDRSVLEFVKMKSGNIKPNTPYLIKAKEAGEKTLHLEDVTVYKAEEKSIECSTTNTKFTFTGTYKSISFSNPFNKKDYYILDGKGLNVSKGTLYLLPYQWYLEIKDRNSAYGIKNMAKEISISVVGEETTGIANIQHTSPNTQIYDLNGRKVNENNLKPGMYVKNGKKFIVK